MAFMTPQAATMRPVTSLFAQADASEAIKAAMEATEKFGIDSPQARVLWDNVEEMRFNNSPATQGGLDEECDIQDQAKIEACIEWEEGMKTLATDKIKQLAESHDEHEYKVEKINDVVDELIEMAKAAPPREFHHEDSSDMKTKIDEAEAAALAASKEFGATSKEARLAWESYEDIASSGLYNAMGHD